jgi:DNA ligase-1
MKTFEQYIKEIPIEYRVFDLLYLNGLDYINEPYESRRADLDDLLDDTPSEMIKSAITVEIKDTLALESFFDHALTMGQEGVILRDGKGVYRPDKRALVKVKGIQKESSALDTLDCVVLDYTEGKGKFEGMAGSFLLGVINEEESAKMGVTVYTEIGSVGGGITDEERKELTEQVKCCRTKLPDVLLEVAFEEITLTDGRYALRFPRIVRSRTDKISPDFLNKVVDMYQVQVKVRR